MVADLERVERKLLALWDAIRLATETGEWRPRPTKLCGWCDHQSVCPEFGGTPPVYPLTVRPAESEQDVQGRMDPVRAEAVACGPRRTLKETLWLSASYWSTTNRCCAPASG